MNKTTAPKYLSLKRIALVALIISLGFHLIMMLSFFFGNSLFSTEASRALHPHHFQLLRFLFFTLTSFIMVFVILLYNRRILSFTFKNKYNELILMILGSAIIASALCIGFILARDAFDPRQPNPEFLFNIMRDSLVRDLTLTAVVLLVVQLLRSQYYQQTTAVENEALRTENILTRFEALKSQLDPHFLFNSLNTLQSLITLDTEKAENYLQQLSSVLRHTLQNKEVISLDEELKCVARALLPEEISEGTKLAYEMFQYSII